MGGATSRENKKIGEIVDDKISKIRQLTYGKEKSELLLSFAKYLNKQPRCKSRKKGLRFAEQSEYRWCVSQFNTPENTKIYIDILNSKLRGRNYSTKN